MVTQDRVRGCTELRAALVFNPCAALGCAHSPALGTAGTIGAHGGLWLVSGCCAIRSIWTDHAIPLDKEKAILEQSWHSWPLHLYGSCFLKSAISHQKGKASPRFLQSTLRAGGAVSLTLQCSTPKHSVVLKQAVLMNKEPASRDSSGSKFHNHCPPLGKAVPSQ